MILKVKILIILISLAFYFIPAIQAQNFLIQKYSVDNGLPDNRVNDIIQDSLGRIWIAMVSGIAMYDGVEWKKFDEEDGVPEIEYIKIKIDEKGIIWFLPRTFNELPIVTKVAKGWKLYNTFVLSLKRPILASDFDITYSDSTPTIYVGNYTKGLFKFEENKWKYINKELELPNDTIYSITKINNKLFIGGKWGFSILDNSKITNHILGGRLQFPSVYAISFKSNSLDQKVLLLGRNWLGEFSRGKFKIIEEKFFLPAFSSGDFYSLKKGIDGNILFGNSAVVYQYSSTNKLHRLLFENITRDRGSNSIIADYEGAYWITTLRGIYKLTEIPFINYTVENELLESEVSAISQFNTGELILGHNYGFTILNDDITKKIKLQKPDPYHTDVSRILDLYHDKRKDLVYFTSLTNGYGTIDSKGNITWMKKSKDFRFLSINKTVSGSVLLGTDGDLFEMRDGFISGYKKKTKVEGVIRKTLIKNENEFYLATGSGLMQINNSQKKLYLSKNKNANNLFSLFIENDQSLLLGAIDGLYMLERDSIIKPNEHYPSISEPIYFIIKDSVKNIWFGTNNGVLKWNGKNLKRYNKSDGLAGNETNRAAGFVDSDGKVWIGTDEGLSMYTGSDLDYLMIKPKLVLLGVEDEQNEEFNFASNVSFNPNNNNLTFNYRGLSFIDEARNVYQVKLSEIDGDWSSEIITNYTYSKFNNILPGDYIFSVRVKNAKGNWSDWKNSSVITIKKYFYQEPLFIIGSILLSLFVLYYIYEYLQQKKYAVKLEKEVDLRTKSLKDYQSKLITSVERYKGIIESQSDLVVRIDAQNKFTFVNDAYCKVFGKSREELLGNSFTPLVHPDDINATLDEMKKLNIPPHRAIMEQRALTTDGYRWFAWEDYAIMDENRNIKEIQGVGKDITITKELGLELEKRVKERTTELRALITQSPFGIMIFNNEGDLIEFNTSADDLFKCNGSFSLSKSHHNIFEDEFLIKNDYNLRLHNLSSGSGLLVTGKIYIDNPETEIYKNLLKHYLIYRIYIIDYEDGKINIVLLIEDITEQQKTEETNKKLEEEKVRVAAIIKTIESERERITRELHDGLGQLLTTAKLKLEIVKIKSADHNSEISEALNLLLSAGDEIRRIINDLKPSDVESFGLAAGIEILCEKMKQNTGINIEYSINNYRSLLNKKIEITIYRVIQEAFNNILKHSKSKCAGVSLNGFKDRLEIKIWDDGIGIDKILPSNYQGGFGIPNIEQRIKNLGGTFNIITSPGNGLKIIINIPII